MRLVRYWRCVKEKWIEESACKDCQNALVVAYFPFVCNFSPSMLSLFFFLVRLALSLRQAALNWNSRARGTVPKRRASSPPFPVLYITPPWPVRTRFGFCREPRTLATARLNYMGVFNNAARLRALCSLPVNFRLFRLTESSLSARHREASIHRFTRNSCFWLVNRVVAGVSTIRVRLRS